MQLHHTESTPYTNASLKLKKIQTTGFEKTEISRSHFTETEPKSHFSGVFNLFTTHVQHSGLGAVWIQGQMAKGQMAKFLLLSHQMFGR
jgi:hypothetical protein